MTENAVKQAFYRFRQRYQTLLREEIANTVATPGDIEDELRHLIAGGPDVTCDRILRSPKGERTSDSPTMTDILRLCPKCGSEIPADAPEGGCPGCLLETALGLLPERSLADGCGSG